MTNQEKIAFRDKARQDFEGKEYKGKVIFQVVIDFDDYGLFSLRNTSDSNIFGCKMFPLSDYDKVLAECKKPFPKDGFSVPINIDGKVDLVNYKLAEYVSEYHKCCFSSNPNHNTYKRPVISIKELENEAKRIIDLL